MGGQLLATDLVCASVPVSRAVHRAGYRLADGGSRCRSAQPQLAFLIGF